MHRVDLRDSSAVDTVPLFTTPIHDLLARSDALKILSGMFHVEHLNLFRTVIVSRETS